MNEVDKHAKVIWDYMHLHREVKPMQAILVLGSSDVRVAEYAAALFLKGYGEYLILTGKNGAVYGKNARLEKPEAEVFADIAREKGVPEEKIIVENESANTGENILFAKRLLEQKGLPLISFVVVHKPYVERRAYATFRKQWPEADIIVTSPAVSYEEYANDPYYKNRWIDIMVGDFQRVKEYPAKGFQIPQDIPSEVQQAYEQLVELGYTSYLIKE